MRQFASDVGEKFTAVFIKKPGVPFWKTKYFHYSLDNFFLVLGNRDVYCANTSQNFMKALSTTLST